MSDLLGVKSYIERLAHDPWDPQDTPLMHDERKGGNGKQSKVERKMQPIEYHYFHKDNGSLLLQFMLIHNAVIRLNYRQGVMSNENHSHLEAES